MTKKPPRWVKRIILAVLGIVLVALLGLSIWLYTGELTQTKLDFFGKLPFPFAFVGGKEVSMKDFVLRYQLSKKITGGQGSQSASLQQISDQLITEAKIDKIASENDVSVSGQQLNDAYAQQANQSTGSASTTFQSFLANYGLSAQSFKDQILIPQLLVIDLQIWFNSQTQLNKGAYQQANNLLQKIQSGQDMATLAKQFSQDGSTKATGGDLGFMQITNPVPEMRQSIAEMKPGDVKIISSRFGLHIIKLEQAIGNQLHLRQIFINTSDFNSWLNSEMTKIKVIKLVKI